MTFPDEPQDDATPTDDRVIARAFWGSIGAAVIVAAGALTWWYWPTSPPPAHEPAPLPEGPAPLAQAPQVPAMPFEEIGEAAGITDARVNGADGRTFLPETMGGGTAIVDVDGDGDLDILVVDGDAWPDAPAGTPRGQGVFVYLNETAPGGPLRLRRASQTGLEAPRQGMGIAAADLNGDGRPELLTTGVGGVRFFLAEPGEPGAPPRWRDATEEAGLAHDPGWSTAAGFVDVDRDGLLDLVVAHYVEWSPKIDEQVNYTLTGVGRAYGPPTGFAGTDLRLYRQVAPLRFEDRTAAAGLKVPNPATGAPMGKALGLALHDFDGDGSPDIAVANDTVQNFLFLNDGTGKFTERGIPSGFALDRSGGATGAMGMDWSHHRDDGAVAVAVGNFANEPSSLYTTTDGRLFSDDAIVEGISAATRRPLTFGVVFADLDGDGREELVQANGHIEERIGQAQPGQRYAQPAQVFWNTGVNSGARFAEVPAAALAALADPVVGRGLAWGDLDGDGALDLVIVPVTGRPRVLRNLTVPHSHLRVTLEDPRTPGNRAGIGATVSIDLPGGGRRQRAIMPARSYLSSVPPEACFADAALPAARALTVRWPDGARERFEVAADATQAHLRRGAGSALDPPRAVPAPEAEGEK